MTQTNKSYTLKSIGTLLRKDAAAFLRKSTMLVGTKKDFQYKFYYLSGKNPWNTTLNLYAVLTNDEIIALIWIAEDIDYQFTLCHIETNLLLAIKKDISDENLLITALKDVFSTFFNDFYASRITAKIEENNKKAAYILEKCGFKLEVTRPYGICIRRSYKTMLIYGLVNNNFKIDEEYENRINDFNKDTLQELPGYELSDISRNS